jgi:plastocyanin
MSGRIRNLRLAAFVILLATASGFGAGCGSDDSGDDDEGNEQAATAPARVEIIATETGKETRLALPESVPAGVVTTELTNDGQAFHEAQLIRLDTGHTPEEALKVIAAEGAPSPRWIHPAGGTGPARPGGSSSATQVLEPGNYMVFDAPFANEGRGIEFGVATFKAEGDAGAGELPDADASIEAYEYGFKVSGLSAGENTIEFSNTGDEPHHVIAAPYAPGATLAEVREAFGPEQQGAEPPLDFENAVSTARIDGGATQVTELNLDEPGKYALLCFVSDREGGPPHVAQGMLAEATVR